MKFISKLILCVCFLSTTASIPAFAAEQIAFVEVASNAQMTASEQKKFEQMEVQALQDSPTIAQESAGEFNWITFAFLLALGSLLATLSQI